MRIYKSTVESYGPTCKGGELRFAVRAQDLGASRSRKFLLSASCSINNHLNLLLRGKKIILNWCTVASRHGQIIDDEPLEPISSAPSTASSCDAILRAKWPFAESILEEAAVDEAAASYSTCNWLKARTRNLLDFPITSRTSFGVEVDAEDDGFLNRNGHRSRAGGC